MPNIRKLKAGYFRTEEEVGTLVDILETILAKPINQRNITISSYPFRIENFAKQNVAGENVYEGDFIKVRMENLPVIASKDEGVEDIGLSDDEGIGEETAFLYAPRPKILILQRNRAGTSYTRAADYFNHFGGGTNIIGFSVMMNRNALQRLRRARAFRSISFSIAPTCSAEELQGSGASLDHAISAMDGLGGEKMSLNVSLKPHGEGSLIKQEVKSAITKLLAFRDRSRSNVSSIKLRAEEDDGVSVIDFIKDRLIFSDDVTIDRDERHLSYTTRRNFLRQAWLSRAFQNQITR